jgi:hypothetical protein
LDVLRWAVENGCEIHVESCMSASQSGEEMTTYLRGLLRNSDLVV